MPLWAWGAIGHMTVAYVAYQQLSPAAKARVRDLLKLNPDFANWEKQIPAGTSPDDHDRRHGFAQIAPRVRQQQSGGDVRHQDLGHRQTHRSEGQS